MLVVAAVTMAGSTWSLFSGPNVTDVSPERAMRQGAGGREFQDARCRARSPQQRLRFFPLPQGQTSFLLLPRLTPFLVAPETHPALNNR